MHVVVAPFDQVPAGKVLPIHDRFVIVKLFKVGFWRLALHQELYAEETAWSLSSLFPSNKTEFAKIATADARKLLPAPRCQAWKRSQEKNIGPWDSSCNKSNSAGRLKNGLSQLMVSIHLGWLLAQSSHGYPSVSAKHWWHMPFGRAREVALLAALWKVRARQPAFNIHGQSPMMLSTTK